MAEWNKNKVEPSAINSGREFTKNDNLFVNELNAIVNNSFFASEKAQRAEELAESAVEGQGTPVTLNGEVLPTWSADFVEAERQKSKNLFDKNNIILNVSLNATGGIKEDSEYFVSNYIKTSGLQNIIVSGGIGDNNYSFFYDENFNTVSELIRIANNQILEVPSNAKYFRFECKKLYVNNNIQTEEGTVATDYQPYNGAIVHEKNIERVEVVYDTESGKTALGGQDYGDGISVGVTISNLNFTKYKRLKLYIVYGGLAIGIGEIDLTKRISISGVMRYGLNLYSAPESDVRDIYFSRILVSSDKTELSYTRAGYYNVEGEWRGRDNYNIYKIEGIY